MTGTPHYYSEADYTLWRCLPCQWPLKQACSQEFFTPEFSMRGFARGRDEKCKRKEPAESANQCEDPQVSVQRTDANLGHQRTCKIIFERGTEKLCELLGFEIFSVSGEIRTARI